MRPEILQKKINAALALHNAHGRRWVGLPRADHQVAYCTHCQFRAPCPTVKALS